MGDLEQDLDKELEALDEKPSTKQGKTRQGTYVGDKSTSFKDFFLKTELEKAIKNAGFEHPSQVQQECIPHALMGDDIICQGKSGMGKTLIFILSILQNIQPSNGQVKALVVAPTKELANQITKEFQRFMEPEKRGMVFFLSGGYPIENAIEALRVRKPSIVVCTPGRCRDLVKRNKLDLGEVRFFVIDEVDEVFKGDGMKKDVEYIYKSLPSRKQVLLFSATMPASIKKLCKKFTKNEKEVFVDSDTKLTLHGLQQFYLNIDEDKKNRKLIEIIERIAYKQIIIFVSKVDRCKMLAEILRSQGLECTTLHSDMNTEERIRCFKEFKNFECRILVTTDLGSRGIDVEKVDLVVNYDMSENSDTYLHRVARSGRFGTTGFAFSFISTDRNREVLEETQKRFEIRMEELKDLASLESFKNT